MPQKDYRAYANSPAGKAARARAHARYVQKRRELNAKPKPDAAPLAQALANWRTSCKS